MKKIVSYLAIVAGGVAAVAPTIYWFINPELTRMQVFYKCLWIFGIALLFGIFAAFLYRKDG